MTLIGLISCTKAKTAHAAPARELYSPSTTFRGALGFLEGRADVIYVLSAKYGLLTLDQVAAPYDETLKTKSRANRQRWAEMVAADLKARHGESLRGITFEFHTGDAYRFPLNNLLVKAGAQCTCPVEGLRQGERIAFYNSGGARPPAALSHPAAAAEAPPIQPPAPEAPRIQPAAPEQDLIATIGRLRGQTLHTVTGKPFDVASVDGDWIVVVPHASDKPRPIKMMEIQAGYRLLLQAGELTVSAIREGGASEANPAYVWALLARLPGIRLAGGYPVRLIL